jgi:hypothetical protein
VLAALAMGCATSAHAGWPEGGLPVAVGAGDQTLIALETDGAGGAYVIWSNPSGPHSLQRITSAGDMAPGWPATGIALAGGANVNPSLGGFLGEATDGVGGMIVFFMGPVYATFVDGFSHRNRQFRAWRYGPDGQLATGWPDTGAVVRTESYNDAFDDWGMENIVMHSNCVDGGGGAYFVFSAFRNPNWYAHRYLHVLADGSGSVQWARPGSPFEGHVSVAPDGGGGIWALDLWRASPEVRLLRFDPNGTQLQLRTFMMSGMLEAQSRITRLLPGTDLLFQWREMGVALPTLTRTDETFATSPGWPATPGTSAHTPILGDGAGGVFTRVSVGGLATLDKVAFESPTPASVWSPAEPPPVYSGSVLASDQAAGIFQAGTDAGVASPLRAIHYLSTGELAPGWPANGAEITSLAEAPRIVPAEPGAAIVGWTDRRESNRDVYLLRVSDEPTTGVDDAIADRRFALAGFRGNPFPGARAKAEFTLPDEAPARLEVLDLAGRVLAKRDVGPLGAGRHTLALPELAVALPGVYFLRLERRGASLVARGALIR